MQTQPGHKPVQRGRCGQLLQCRGEVILVPGEGNKELEQEWITAGESEDCSLLACIEANVGPVQERCRGGRVQGRQGD